MIDISEYKYKYETHLHTSEGSACGKEPGDKMAEAVLAAGYNGFFVTDHAWGGNTAVDRTLSWKDWVYEFAKGYEKAKEWADRNGLLCMFGYEAGYEATEFLIYGLTPDMMADTPELHDATIEEQLLIVHDLGGLVIQAHPYRKEYYIPKVRLFPEYADGIEAINATHSNHLSRSHNTKEWNDLAIELAHKYKKPMTAGSDVHSTVMFGGGVMTSKPLNSPEDYRDLILSDRMYLLTDGDRIYDRYGKFICEVLGQE